MAALLSLCIWTGLIFPVPKHPAHYQPAQPEPKREAIVAATRHSKVGIATHYAYHKGQAAASHTLQRAIGRRWRGTKVHVCKDKTCIDVVLTDSCWCPNPLRLIDLDKRDFVSFLPLWRGTIKEVRVSW